MVVVVEVGTVMEMQWCVTSPAAAAAAEALTAAGALALLDCQRPCDCSLPAPLDSSQPDWGSRQRQPRQQLQQHQHQLLQRQQLGGSGALRWHQTSAWVPQQAY